jgi:murein DD-endopeptidase MepM/ murein hydrolase activator NlpD
MVTSITLVSGATIVCSASERLDDRVPPMRRLRARLAERRPEVDRRREERMAFPTLWPVRGTVSSPFGWRASPYGGQSEFHRGVDITAPYGTPVCAAADGEVVFAGHVRGYGGLVILDHGTATTRYAHLAAISVRSGRSVLRGDPVGTLGGSGRATAPHLHYEVRLGSEPVDPECVLAGPAHTEFAHGAGRSHACALARAPLGVRKSETTGRDAARALTSRRGGAGS